MKTLVTTAAVTLALSFNAAAALNNNVKFVGVDETETTQICLEAARQGYSSAIGLAQSLGFGKAEAKSTICNGKSLLSFAREFKVAAEPKVVVKKAVAANENYASQICTDAATYSLAYAEDKYGKIDDVFCNGSSIKRFVKRFQL